MILAYITGSKNASHSKRFSYSNTVVPLIEEQVAFDMIILSEYVKHMFHKLIKFYSVALPFYF